MMRTGSLAMADFLDPAWYLERYSHARLTVENGTFSSAMEHFCHYGFHQLYAPGPLFDTLSYRRSCPSWDPAGTVNPVDHFLAQRSHSSPHYLFSERFYRGLNPSVGDSVEQGEFAGAYAHFLLRGQTQGLRPHPLFSQINPNAFEDSAPLPRRTFSEFCHSPSTSPSVLFDEDWYRKSSDWDESNERFHHSLHYFLTRGVDLGHICCPEFDSQYYVGKHPEAPQSVADGYFASDFEHWLFQGVRRGHDPNAFFQTEYYLQHNPEAARESSQLGLLGPFEHFLLIGKQRGWRSRPPMAQVAVDLTSTRAAFCRNARLRARRVRDEGLTFTPSKNPAVSIVMVVHNQWELTVSALAALHAQAPDAQVILCDNASTDATLDIGDFVRGICVSRSSTNDGFPAACNRGWRIATAPVVILANNDILPEPAAIARIASAFDDASIGVAGATVLQTNGLLQESGCIIWSSGETYGYGRGEDPLLPRFQNMRDVDYCSACLLGVRTSLLHELDGFDEAYTPGYYEETDLCVRAWQAGSRCVVVPDAAVIHLERGSFSAQTPLASAALLAQHRRLFVEKQPGFLRDQLPFDSGLIDLAAHRTRRQRGEILVVDDFPPVKERGAGLGRAAQVLSAILANTTEPVLWISTRPEQEQPGYDEVDLDKRVTWVKSEELPCSLDHYLVTNARRFTRIWINRTHNAQSVTSAIRHIRAEAHRPRLILDTEAVTSVREFQRRSLTGCSADLDRMVSDELRPARDYDGVIAVNSVDASYLKRHSATAIEIAGHNLPKLSRASADGRSGLLFVGAIADSHSPNLDTLQWLLTEVWPLVLNKNPGSHLTVAGYWAKHVLPTDELRDTAGVRWLGSVADLTNCYETHRGFIAPSRIASGIPIKVLEAGAHGLPCVVSSLLADQLQWGELKGCLHDGDPARLAQHAASLLTTDVGTWSSWSLSIQQRVQRDTAAETFNRAIRRVLDV